MESKIYILHARNSGTPEANEVEVVSTDPLKLYDLAKSYLLDQRLWNLSEDEVEDELGTRDEWESGNFFEGDSDYYYLSEQELI